MPKFKKKALVTGASARIGHKIAKHLRQNGYEVLIHSHKNDYKKNEDFDYIVCDFRDQNQLEQMVKSLEDITLLVNNASCFKKDEVANVTIENLTAHFAVGAFAPLYLTSKLPDLTDVINILDAGVNCNDDFFLSYKLAKRSFEDITKITAKNMASKGVRINAIALGFIAAPEHVSPKFYEKLISQTPLKMQTSTAELQCCIDAILKCKSMTGNIIYLDSGVAL